MKSLLILLITFALALLVLHFIQGGWNEVLSANIAMACMLMFTAIEHFIYREGMIMMIPDVIPAKREMVLLTAMWEACFAAGLCIEQVRHTVSIWLILFFLFLLPANINASIKHVNYQKANYEGRGVMYLWFRIPLQLFFIFWVVYFNLILTK